MFKRFLMCAVMTSLVVLVGMSLGCNRTPSPTQPTSPTQPPVVVPSGPPPSVTAVSPDTGSTGGTGVTITGTGFRSPAIVTLGGITITQYVFTSTTIIASAPAHVAGSVDVIVTNPDGQAGRLGGGYTYVSPDSFEANGNWEGGADSNYSTPLRFTIQNNTLTSVSCGTSANLTYASPPLVSNGEFSAVGDGASISGRIVSPNYSQGTINIAPCLAFPWGASRQSGTRSSGFERARNGDAQLRLPATRLASEDEGSPVGYGR
jgi:hypothetical protein